MGQPDQSRNANRYETSQIQTKMLTEINYEFQNLDTQHKAAKLFRTICNNTRCCKLN